LCILNSRIETLAGLQTLFSKTRRERPGTLRAATVLCLILLAVLTVVQVAHTHTVDTDADHCPLCIVMHTAAPVAVTAAIVVLVQIETRTPVYAAHAVTRHWHPKLFTRPPPTNC
jgi:hypothetical protein